GADFVVPFSRFIGLIEQLVRRQNNRRLLRYKEVVANLQVILLEFFDFASEHDRVEHHPVADHVLGGLPKNAGRNLMEYMLDAIEFKGMAGVRASLKTRNNVIARGQYIDNFSLTFISPLKA